MGKLGERSGLSEDNAILVRKLAYNNGLPPSAIAPYVHADISRVQAEIYDMNKTLDELEAMPI